MPKRVVRFVSALAMLTVFASLAVAQSDQQKLLNEAEASLSNFMRDPDMSWLQENISKARAVIIAPQVTKAGFILGGSGGRAVVYAHDTSGKWVGPVFYRLLTGSIGFQAGVSVSESLMLVMTDKGFNALLSSSFKVGGDASVAVGPVGAGATSNITADVIAFSRSKGIYGGLNVDGTAVTVNDGWNAAFYGKAVSPADVFVRMSVHESGGDALAAALAKGTS